MSLTSRAGMTIAADSRSRIDAIHACGVTILRLLVILSCSFSAVASEHDLRVDVSIGAVIDIEGEGDILWLGTAEGLFRWNTKREGGPERVPVDTGNVYILLFSDNTLWIGSERGLFRWDNPGQGVPQPVEADRDTGSVDKLYKLNQALLIGSKKGLFIWRSVDVGIPILTNVDVSHITTFYRDKGNQLWIGSQKGLLFYDGGDGEPIFLPQFKDVYITGICDGDSDLLIGTVEGLLRWNKIVGDDPKWVLADTPVHSLHKDGSTLLISTKSKGLFRLNNVRAGQPELIDSRIGISYKYLRSGNILWMAAGMGAEAGLFRWDSKKGGAPERVTAISTGYIHDFYASGGTLWIGAHNGLFRVEGLDTEWNAQLEVISSLPKTIYPDTNLLIRWQVDSFGWRTTPEQVQYGVIVKDAGGQDVQPGGWDVLGKQEFTLPPLPEGTYNLYIQATDLNGKTAVSPSVHFTVDPPQKDGWLAKLADGALVLVVVLVMILLPPRLIAYLLQLDVWGINKIAPAFYLLPFGRWKLYRRYRRQLRRSPDVRYSAQRYVDLPYESDELETDAVSLSDLFARLTATKCVVVIADGGRGKSTLCHKLAQRCITDGDLFGGKHLEPVVIDGLSYTGDLLNTITNALKEGRAYVNKTIVESQVEAGYLLIIFDGFSEIRETYLNAASAEDLPSFVRQHPNAHFIFTSRSNLPPGVQQALGETVTIRLRDLDEKTVRPFLSQYLKRGAQEVDAVIREIGVRFPDLPPIPLMLKLIATVYDKKAKVPKNTMALFADYVEQLLRPEATGIDEPNGLHFAIRHLVRETYLRSGGDRGFTVDQGVELLDKIKERLAAYDIRLPPIKLLNLLIRAGLYKRIGENVKFFHDSFESYFAARALESDFRARPHKLQLLRLCAGNDRLHETWKFLDEILEETGDKQKLEEVLQDESK